MTRTREAHERIKAEIVRVVDQRFPEPPRRTSASTSAAS